MSVKMSSAQVVLLLLAVLCEASFCFEDQQPSSADDLLSEPRIKGENFRCPNGKFTCKSGACIDASGRCDGMVQCEDDSSDEDPAMCSQCPLPEKPENGDYTVGGCNSPNCGPFVDHNTTVDFFCSPGYVLVGIKETVCSSGQWISPSPNCTPCGRRHTNVSAPAERRFVQRGEYPWRVGIYVVNETKLYEPLCGGSIISHRYVLTAAHCFEEYPKGVIRDEKNYIIVAGKLRREFYDDERDTQMRNIQKIITNPDYKGMVFDYDDDISVLLVDKEFIFNPVVQPVCIDWSKTSDFTSERSGVATGWCYPGGVLLTTPFAVINYMSCYEKVIPSLRRFLNKNKFCADGGEETVVCRGDSGEGVFFEQSVTKSSDPVFFVHGIASLKAADYTLGVKDYVVFTKVTSYLDWLKSYV